MSRFWKIFIGLNIFGFIISILTFYFMAFYPIIFCLNLASSLLIYIIFMVLKKYKINHFLNIVFSTALVVSLNILISHIFFDSVKVPQMLINISITYICFQLFMIILLED